MSLIYGAFAMILSISIFANIIINRPSGNQHSDAYSWSVVGLVYLLQFLTMMIFNTAPDYMIYIFQVLSCIGFIWQFRILEFKRNITNITVPLGTIAFVIAWTLMGTYTNMGKLAVLTPSVLILTGTSFMMATYFFMQTDKDIHLKSVIGILYGMMTIIKFMYIANAINDDPIFFIGLFVLDFMIFMIIAVLVFLNSHYTNLITQSKRSHYISDLLDQAPEPMALLTNTGNVIYTNSCMKEEMKQRSQDLNGIEDLFAMFAPDNVEWCQAAKEGFERGEGCTFSVARQEGQNAEQYFACDVFPIGDTYSIFFRLRSYPSDGFWTNGIDDRFSVMASNNHDGLMAVESEQKYLDSDRIDLKEHLEKAVHNGELTMKYQPQVHLKTGEFRGFEGLIRWVLADGKQVSPNIFIPMAEDLGLIDEIGMWVLEEAVMKAAEWHHDFGYDFIMSVNMSSHQLEDPEIVAKIAGLLDKYGYLPAFLELEVTESKILKNSKEVYATLHALKELGIRIAMDDFGTGYSSLDYLRWLPFDVLKIDKTFIDNIRTDTIEREIVRSVIGLVNNMALETVAEGVEHHDQLNFLQDAGCSCIQGYLYSKPLSDFESREFLMNLD